MRTLALILLAGVAWCPAHAGNLGDLSRLRPRDQTRDRLAVERLARSAGTAIGTEWHALTEAIDPTSYPLTPGDLLIFGVWGAADLVVEVQVSADGNLIVPSVGVIPVEGVTMEQARALLRERCAESYPHSEVTLTLTHPAPRRIPITGEVAYPGLYEVPATSRLADLVELAGGLRDAADSRAIRIEGRGGEAQCVDLLAWMIDGQGSGNPTLAFGDRVHIPPATELYRVRGVLPPPERVSEHRSSFLDRPFESETRLVPTAAGDDLAFILRAAGALGSDFCDEGVWVEGNWTLLTDADRIHPAPGSAINVPFCREWVAVGGAATRPGLYPFLPGQTVADYIDAAGGPNDSGRNNGWKIEHPGEGRRCGAAPGDPVPAGARIWIPERRSKTITTWLAPVATLAAVTVSIVALSR